MPESTEVRCPQGPRNLLMKLRLDSEAPAPRTKDNLLEIFCRDCTRHARRQMDQAGLPTTFRVIHCFDFMGEFVESVREPLADADISSDRKGGRAT